MATCVPHTRGDDTPAPIIVCMNDDTKEIEKFAVNPRWVDLASFDKSTPKLRSIEPLSDSDKDELH